MCIHPGLNKALISLILLLSLIHPDRSLAEGKVSFCAVGDILLDRGVRKMIEKNGVDYPFERTAKYIHSHDLAFCNLECPISDKGSPVSKIYTFRGDRAFVEGLKRSGFNIFCLANNHTLDYGREALLETKEILQENGFYTVGVGKNQIEASKGRIIEIKGVTFAFLAYVTMPLEGIAYTEDLPVPAQADIEEILQEIRRMRGLVDFVIASFHWGVESSPFPSEKQKEYAHLAIDNGADLVIGHHPHVIQGIERYKGKFIIYSLGNFIFDQKNREGRETFIFGCSFGGKKILSPYVIPVMIEECQPRLAFGRDYKRIEI